MGLMQRNKGKRGEREAVKFWQDIFPEAKRHFEFTKDEAVMGADVILDDLWAIQVKIGEQVPKTCYRFLDQIKDWTGLGFVQMRRDKEKKWIVMLDAELFKMLIRMTRST